MPRDRVLLDEDAVALEIEPGILQSRFVFSALTLRLNELDLERPRIDLRQEFGPEPDIDEIYDHLIRTMQETLDALASERRLPVIG